MKVSMEQVRKVIEQTKLKPAELKTETLFDKDLAAPADAKLIREVVDEVMKMPEVRAELVAELKARVERGEYNPSSEEIVEAMVRRAIADKLR
ncbi:MAG: flagellar biosynthesis anti-sigma factor FlgM [Fimbriimonadales bacterium]|jgi:negative regulator of flagellin synthesis FlgM|nr:flagellar biosynthesis anti-sigma factor FlgM [Fimbriimonadales bacterium]